METINSDGGKENYAMRTSELLSAAQCSKDKRAPKFYEAFKANVYLQCLHRLGVTQCKFFMQERGTHSSRQIESNTVGLPQLCVVCAANEKRRFRMFCPNAVKWPMSAPHDRLSSP
ncbi:hypothetical protein PoB_005853400 [Plakobranchus ocellatus]|uniref:Uncharacterized protein n=1 Tax=Plakobranchus ocellatus TaxID=259542 RepID=A0AAV4CH07_9GAST|nr:hypothetical protein PoB_005853400 [Plakobranchus ocellatus]